MRWILWPIGLLYAGITSLRNYFYDKGWLKTFAFDFPVILVGNLSTGGTGKTPHVEYIISILREKYKVSVLSRGYKRALKGYAMATDLSLVEDIGDEPKQIKQKFPDVEVAVSADRVRGVYYILQDEPDTGVIVMDDGMQHRRITASLTIMLTAYQKPFYSDHILPVGNLRETRRGVKRAQLIIVTKCPADITQKERENIAASIAPNSSQKIFFSTEEYGALYPLFGGQEILSATGKDANVVSGIASHTHLIEAVRRENTVVGQMEYRDHHYFTTRDLQHMREKTAPGNICITTEKDAMRLMEQEASILELGLSFFVLPMSIRIIEDAAGFDALIKGHPGTVDIQPA